MKFWKEWYNQDKKIISLKSKKKLRKRNAKKNLLSSKRKRVYTKRSKGK